jgi:hypothetical protein
MSSVASAFVHATRKRSQKVPRTKSGMFWFPWMDLHDSTLEQKFYIERFQRYTINFSTTAWYFSFIEYVTI